MYNIDILKKLFASITPDTKVTFLFCSYFFIAKNTHEVNIFSDTGYLFRTRSKCSQTRAMTTRVVWTPSFTRGISRTGPSQGWSSTPWSSSTPAWSSSGLSATSLSWSRSRWWKVRVNLCRQIFPIKITFSLGFFYLGSDVTASFLVSREKSHRAII